MSTNVCCCLQVLKSLMQPVAEALPEDVLSTAAAILAPQTGLSDKPRSAFTTISLCLLPVVYVYYHWSASTTIVSVTSAKRLPPLVCIFNPWSASTTVDECLLPLVCVYNHRCVSTTSGIHLLPSVCVYHPWSASTSIGRVAVCIGWAWICA